MASYGESALTFLGIQQFKAFLESIIYPKDLEPVPRKRTILREYLDLEKPKENDEEGAYLSSLLLAWAFASSSNEDALFSAIASVLALLVKTLSAHLDFRDHGLGVCRSILVPATLKTVARGLSREKSKAYIISPCLRLLTEVVAFDGGALARQLYQKRDLTFDTKALSRNLHVRERRDGLSDEEKKKPTIRSNAVRYLLANLRFQHQSAKVDILKQGNIVRALFDGIEDDPLPLALEIISYLRAYVADDKILPRSRKSYVFNEDNLHSLYKLFAVSIASDAEGNGMKEQVQEFLYHLCTESDAGVLRGSTGWYPPNTDADRASKQLDEEAHQQSVFGLESIESYSKDGGKIPIRNIALADFAQRVRPYANNDERRLLITIFQAAPELVADYYFKKRSFTFLPKLTTTWIGYASVLFETVLLPVPAYFGSRTDYADVPPPPSIAIESIMPQPLTQDALSKCVNSDSDLIRLFAIRILALAFRKLQEVLRRFRKLAENGSQLWTKAADNLLSDFIRRCPGMKEIVLAFRKAPKENLVQREAITRLLALVYDVMPQIALAEKFDITVALNTALQDIDRDADSTESKGLRLLELDHLVHIALWSQHDISWAKKHQGLQYTPFVTLLKLASTTQAEISPEVKAVLGAVVRDTDVLQSETLPTALDAIIISLRNQDSLSLENVLVLLDDCFQRFSARRIIYEDGKDALLHDYEMEAAQTGPFSLLMMTLLEQWPHKQKLGTDSATRMACWLNHFLNLLHHIGEDKTMLHAWVAAVEKATQDENVRRTFSSAFDIQKLYALLPLPTAWERVLAKANRNRCMPSALASEAIGLVTTTERKELPAMETPLLPAFDIMTLLPPAEDPNHAAISRFKKASADLQSYIEDGGLALLLLYLSSPDLSIRRQTLLLLKQLVSKLLSSTYAEAPMVHLLVGELIETYEQYQQHPRPSFPLDQTASEDIELPLPYLTTSFASHALPILTDPTSPLYPKLCTYLCRGPSWHPASQLLTLATQILSHPPSDPDAADAAHYAELTWLLDWVADGVRGAADADLVRRAALIERLAALWNHPSLARFRRLEGLEEGAEVGKGSLQSCVRSAIVRIVARVALVPGGATMLLTRSGTLAWLQGVRQLGLVDERGKEILKVLEDEIVKRADPERLEEWGSGLLGPKG